MKKIALVFIVLFGLHGCKRSTDTVGPMACPSSSFAVTTPFVLKDSLTSHTDTLNLSTSYAIFAAAFNESISYSLTISGATSGAQYVYNGISSSLHRHWYGNATNGKHFVKGEILSYTLKNLCQTEPLGTGSIVLNTIVGLSQVDKTFGLFINNAENEAYKGGYGPMSNAPCGAQDTPANKLKLITKDSVGYSPSPQGGNYYKYKATCTGVVAPTAYYFGGLDYATTPAMFATLPTDPSRVYLNFYAKGQHNSLAGMSIIEMVYGNPLTRSYNKAVVSGDWTLFSVRLSDLGIIDPSQINKLSFTLGTYFADTSAEVELDMVIFTVDKPL